MQLDFFLGKITKLFLKSSHFFIYLSPYHLNMHIVKGNEK